MRLLKDLIQRERPKETTRATSSSEEPPEEEPASSLSEPLTPREEEVLRLLGRGKTNRQIARDLFISRSTVKHHVGHLMAKLGASDRVQAAVIAIELGLLTDYFN